MTLLNWEREKKPTYGKENELKRELWVGWKKKEKSGFGCWVRVEERRGERIKGGGGTSTLPPHEYVVEKCNWQSN